MVAGIGGTGVVTIGHILGMAAHLENKGAALIDMVGISQKNGAVVTHLKIAATPAGISAVRIAPGSADLILGCDVVTAASERILASASPERTAAVINSHETMPAQFTYDRNFDIKANALLLRIGAATHRQKLSTIDATGLATALTGDAMAANLFSLGYAWQKGLIPIGAEAIAEAVRLNGVSVDMNLAAFAWGRRAAADEAAVRKVLERRLPALPAPESLPEIIARRAEFLTAYQNEIYARQYRDFVAAVQAAEARVLPGHTEFTQAVATNLFKLMAYKDEYEVARLLTDASFTDRIARQFDGSAKPTYHLAPPFLAKLDPATGRPKKSAFGPWLGPWLRLLAKFKFLRGSAFDPFGRQEERRQERQFIAHYREMLDELLATLSPANHATAVELARLPDQIRGFGPVKQNAVDQTMRREKELLAAYRSCLSVPRAAE
jgi:indolepyruvate ferredoxin oxidoreductase